MARHTPLCVVVLVFGVVLNTSISPVSGFFVSMGPSISRPFSASTRGQASTAQASGVSGSDVAPVVFIPGTGGNQLQAKIDKKSVPHFFCSKKSDWFRLWLDTKSLVPGAISCWADNMKMRFSKEEGTFYNNEGVEVRVPGWGNFDGMEYLDPTLRIPYLKKFMNQFVAAGYQIGKTLKGAPYDFRRGPVSNLKYFDDLKDLVEESFNTNNRKVTLMAHSMGGLQAQYFLSQQSSEWKAKYIRRLVTLGTPFLGANKIMRLMASGDNEGIPIVSPLSTREEQRSSESNFWMIPLDTVDTASHVIVKTPSRSYTVKQIREFIADAHPEGLDAFDAVRKATGTRPAPGVEALCIVGTGTDTASSFEYETRDFDKQPKEITGDGDGTVNVDSARACAKWAQEQDAPVEVIEVEKVAHSDLVTDPKVLEKVLSYLQKE